MSMTEPVGTHETAVWLDLCEDAQNEPDGAFKEPSIIVGSLYKRKKHDIN